MVKVNGVTLIDRMLHQIEELGLARIVIVIGYKGEDLKKYIETLGIATPIYRQTVPIRMPTTMLSFAIRNGPFSTTV